MRKRFIRAATAYLRSLFFGWTQRANQQGLLSPALPNGATAPYSGIGSITFPLPLTAAVLGICVLPFLLNLIGVEFGSTPSALSGEVAANLSKSELIEAMHQALEGSYTHTILEWSAFCTAIFTVVLAFACFANKPDVATPILGVALLCAGIMDAFHTLAADRLIEAAAANSDLIPFTWALCRLFNALISIVGTGLLLAGNFRRSWRFNALFVFATSFIFVLIAYLTIRICANSQNLPQTTFPDGFVTRPWDVLPLFLFLSAGIWLYPAFYRKYPSLFSSALIVSTIPNVITQVHMAFGSTALFDNHFNIAHFLKIIAYLVPLAGLVLDYVYTQRTLEARNGEFYREIQDRKAAQHQLQVTLADLKQTQVQLIQSEKMSGLGQMVSGIAHEINNPVNFIHGNLRYLNDCVKDLVDLSTLYQFTYTEPPETIQTKLEDVDLTFLQTDIPKLLKSMKMGTERIREIVQSLRTFSRLDEAACKDADIHAGLESTLLILQHRLQAQPDRPAVKIVRHYDKLPLIECYAGQLNQVFMNVMANALDAMEDRDCDRTYEEMQKSPSMLTLTTELLSAENRLLVTIEDNGPGISDETLSKMFDPFFTTKPVGKGTGLGMSISHQIVTEHHKGTLTCHSTVGEGTAFTIRIPTLLEA